MSDTQNTVCRGCKYAEPYPAPYEREGECKYPRQMIPYGIQVYSNCIDLDTPHWRVCECREGVNEVQELTSELEDANCLIEDARDRYDEFLNKWYDVKEDLEANYVHKTVCDAMVRIAQRKR